MPGSLGYEEQDAKTFASWVYIFIWHCFFVKQGMSTTFFQHFF